MHLSTKEHLVCGLSQDELNYIVIALYGYKNHNKRRAGNDPSFQELLDKVTDAYLLSNELNKEVIGISAGPIGCAEGKLLLAENS